MIVKAQIFLLSAYAVRALQLRYRPAFGKSEFRSMAAALHLLPLSYCSSLPPMDRSEPSCNSVVGKCSRRN